MANDVYNRRDMDIEAMKEILNPGGPPGGAKER